MIVDNELKEIFSNPNKNIENMSKTELLLLKNEMIRNPNNYGLIEKSFEKISGYYPDEVVVRVKNLIYNQKQKYGNMFE